MVKGQGKYLSADYEKVVDVFLKQFTQQEHPNITREALRSILFEDDYSPSAEVETDLANSTFENVQKLKLAMLQFPLKQVGNESGDIGVLGSLYNGGDQHLKISDISEMERFKNSVSTGADELIGNVKADDGETIVLENGTDGTNATFKGDVTGNLNGNVIGDVTGDVIGDVKATDGTIILKNSTNGSDARFIGDVANSARDIILKATSNILNTAIGAGAFEKNTTGVQNTAIGRVALYENTEGRDNTAIGLNACRENTTGDRNTAIGSFAMEMNKTGENNTAVGQGALYSDVSGNDNTAVGQRALYENIGGSNTAIGQSALRRNTTGNQNTAVGKDCLYFNTTGSNNIAIGERASHQNSTGDYNVSVGFKTNSENRDGDKNTAVGGDAGVYGNNLENTTAIGYNARVSNSNTVKLGNDDVTDIKTNKFCRITSGFLRLENIKNVGYEAPDTFFRRNFAGNEGDIHIAKDSNGKFYLMLCTTTGNTQNAQWTSLTFA